MSSLFKTSKKTIENVQIDEMIIHTLYECDWFGSREHDELIEKYKINVNENITEYNEKITNAQNKMFGLLRAECETRNCDKNTKNIVIKVGQYLLERNNLNNFSNPLHYNKYDERTGDISCDSSSGYNGNNGMMDCWKLEENSRTSPFEISLQDAIFNKKSWDAKNYTKRDIDLMVLVGQIFCDIGFDVYWFGLSLWRKGYDYKCTKFEKNNIEKIMNSCVDEAKYFRIYIDKDYS